MERTITVNLDALPELAGLAIDLDTVVQELLESRTVEDTVASRLGVVDDELVLSSSRLSGGGLGLHGEKRQRENPVSLLRRGLSKAVGATDHLEGGRGGTSGLGESERLLRTSKTFPRAPSVVLYSCLGRVPTHACRRQIIADIPNLEETLTI